MITVLMNKEYVIYDFGVAWCEQYCIDDWSSIGNTFSFENEIDYCYFVNYFHSAMLKEETIEVKFDNPRWI